MAKDIKFNVRLFVDGKEHLISATTDIKELSKNFKIASESILGFRRASADTGVKLLGLQATISSLQQISSTLNMTTEESRSFGGAMRAANTMAGKGSEDFAKLKGQVSDLSKAIPLTRDQLANGLYQVISNGVPEDNWITYLQTSARSAVGGIADVGEVVKVTSTIIKNYGLEWSAAQDIQDKIQLTAKNGVTSFEQLAAALPSVTGQAAQLGVSFTEMLAVMSTLTGVTGNTSEVATQLGSVLTALTKESSKSQKMAEAMGISFNAASIKAAGGLKNYLQELDKTITAYAAKSGQLKESIYAKLFGRAEALRLTNALTGQLAGKFEENIAALENSAGTMDVAFEDMASTSSSKFQMIKNAWASMTDGITAGVNALTPYLNFGATLGLTVTSVLTLRRAVLSLGVAQTVLALRLRATTTAALLWRRVGISLAALNRALHTGFTQAAVGATTLKMAIRGLLASTGMGVALVALSFAVEKLINAFDSSDDAVETEDGLLDRFGESADKAAGKVNGLYAILQNSAAGTKVSTEAARELQQVAEGYGITLSEEATKIGNEALLVEELTAKREELTDAIRREAVERERAAVASQVEENRAKKVADARNELIRVAKASTNDEFGGRLALTITDEDIARYQELTKAFEDLNKQGRSREANSVLQDRAALTNQIQQKVFEYMRALEELEGEEGKYTKNSYAMSYAVAEFLNTVSHANLEHEKSELAMAKANLAMRGNISMIEATRMKSQQLVDITRDLITVWNSTHVMQLKISVDADDLSKLPGWMKNMDNGQLQRSIAARQSALRQGKGIRSGGVGRTQEQTAVEVAQMSSLLASRTKPEDTPQPTTITPTATSGKSGKSHKETEKKLIENASTYKELANNVAYYQQELEKCNVADTERISVLAKARKAAEDAAQAFKDMVAAATVPENPASLDEFSKQLQALQQQRKTAKKEDLAAIDEKIRKAEQAQRTFENAPIAALKPEDLKTLDDCGRKLSYLQQLRKTASKEEIADIDKQIEEVERLQDKLENASIDALWAEDIKTQEQLNAKMARYNKLIETGTEAQRIFAQRGIQYLEKLRREWEMAMRAATLPKGTSNLADIDTQIQFYTERQQREDADQMQKTQEIIDRLTLAKKPLQLAAELPSMQREAAEIDALTGREHRVRIRAMGFDELTQKIRDLQKTLSDTENPVTDSQRKQIEGLISTYSKWRKQSVMSLDTVKNGWGGIKGIGDTIQGMTDALEGNGNEWQKITAVIDGFLQIAEGINTIIGIVRMLTGVTEQHTQAKQQENAAQAASTSLQVAGTAATAADTAATTAHAVAEKVDASASQTATSAKGGEAIANATSEGAKLAFPYNLIAIAAGVAAVIAALSNIGKFATGGIVGGNSPTGDKLLARVNSGEMILSRRQQQRLLRMLSGIGAGIGYPTPPRRDLSGSVNYSVNHHLLAPAGAGGTVRFELTGRKLVGVLANETRISSRSGRRTNIKL